MQPPSVESDVSEQVDQVLSGVRALATVNNELGRIFARSRGMHTTDAAAVVEILTAEARGEPMTPARLAERISLTTGATSTLLNRLEKAGHVVRSREHRDRRLVTLHSTSGVHAASEEFFAPLAARLAEVLGDYSGAELEVLAEVTARLRAAMSAYAEECAAT